jgi:hypothetical protein
MLRTRNGAGIKHNSGKCLSILIQWPELSTVDFKTTVWVHVPAEVIALAPSKTSQLSKKCRGICPTVIPTAPKFGSQRNFFHIVPVGIAHLSSEASQLPVFLANKTVPLFYKAEAYPIL